MKRVYSPCDFKLDQYKNVVETYKIQILVIDNKKKKKVIVFFAVDKSTWTYRSSVLEIIFGRCFDVGGPYTRVVKNGREPASSFNR